PHEVLEEIESVKNNGESTAGFLITAAIGEIKRRQRKKAKEADKE
ncbi:YlcI/YnfO family protein, partial [Klebsiella pneumoniae]